MKNIKTKKPLKVYTWHVHGSYLYYLSFADCIFYIPKGKKGELGYGGKDGIAKTRDNIIEVPVDKVKDLELDCIMFQSKKNYLEDQFNDLSISQRALPKIYVEHDCPRESPMDQKHIVDDPNILLVHVTNFNDLMWNNNRTPTKVIDHGVVIPKGVRYYGELDRGIVIVNNIKLRGRRAGYDVFEKVRKEVPLDIIGMGSEEVGGEGEIPIKDLPEYVSHYRFYFHPMRYTSLGLSAIEAMMAGLPIVALATTELVTVINNDYNGYISTNINYLIKKMKELLINKTKAYEIGANAKKTSLERFGIKRFACEWEDTIEAMIKSRNPILSKIVDPQSSEFLIDSGKGLKII